jgi:hypothetical protein
LFRVRSPHIGRAASLMIPNGSQMTACVTISAAPWRCQQASLRSGDPQRKIPRAVFSLRQSVPSAPYNSSLARLGSGTICALSRQSRPR